MIDYILRSIITSSTLHREPWSMTLQKSKWPSITGRSGASGNHNTLQCRFAMLKFTNKTAFPYT